MNKAKRDRLQAEAFKSFYKFHRLAGLSIEISFAGAIEKTSDDAFREIYKHPERVAALKEWRGAELKPIQNESAILPPV